MSVKIHGKEYKTVAERINDAHDRNETMNVATELLTFNDDIVVMKATVVLPKGSYDGHAFEKIGSSQINKTSALENCETSAVGRALAAAGLGGTEYASANEVQNAIHQQNTGVGSAAKTNGAVAPNRTASGSVPPLSSLNQEITTDQIMQMQIPEGIGSPSEGKSYGEIFGATTIPVIEQQIDIYQKTSKTEPELKHLSNLKMVKVAMSLGEGVSNGI